MSFVGLQELIMKILLLVFLGLSAVYAADPKSSNPKLSKSGFIDNLPEDIQDSIQEILDKVPMMRLPVNNFPDEQLKFFLYNRETLKPIELTSTTTHLIDKSKPIKIIIHDWLQTRESNWVIKMKDQYLLRGHYNVIVVDWEKPAFEVYGISATHAMQVGKLIAKFIFTARLPVANIHLIGHGMGAHITGYVGKEVNTWTVVVSIAKISALDPMGPAFVNAVSKYKLQKSDAKVVDVVHTDSQIFGTDLNLGTVDLYPNNGESLQPGCPKHDVDEECVSCSHMRSVLFFTESINSKCFIATECSSWTEYIADRCENNRRMIFGENMSSTINYSNSYFFKTNAYGYFAQGCKRDEFQ